MSCLNCGAETSSDNAVLWDGRLFLCAVCAELADEARTAIKQACLRAEAIMLKELDDAILEHNLAGFSCQD